MLYSHTSRVYTALQHSTQGRTVAIFSERTDGLYQEYVNQLAYGEALGFDGLVLNEHHQTIYELMPSPTQPARGARAGDVAPLREFFGAAKR